MTQTECILRASTSDPGSGYGVIRQTQPSLLSPSCKAAGGGGAFFFIGSKHRQFALVSEGTGRTLSRNFSGVLGGCGRSSGGMRGDGKGGSFGGTISWVACDDVGGSRNCSERVAVNGSLPFRRLMRESDWGELIAVLRTCSKGSQESNWLDSRW